MGVGWKSNAGGATVISSSDSSVTVVEAPAGTFDLKVSAATIGALPLTGGTMSGDIDMGGNSVINATLVIATTGVNTTTAALGFAHVYEVTAAPVTLTVSTADFVEGREIKFGVRTASATVGTPVTIATAGAQTIDGDATVDLTFDFDNHTFVVRGGSLVSA